MTLNNIKEQTKAITDYANLLNKIKGKVGSGLFAEISNMGIEEGSQYINKLLSMSSEDLKAYNAAYEEK